MGEMIKKCKNINLKVNTFNEHVVNVIQFARYYYVLM